jgi:hypothetical protein
MKYIALYRRYYVIGNEEFDSFDEALEFLQNQEDEGEIFPIAIIHNKKMVWYKEFLGKKNCLKHVKEFNLTNKIKP